MMNMLITQSDGGNRFGNKKPLSSGF